jgi:hypothetical protein
MVERVCKRKDVERHGIAFGYLDYSHQLGSLTLVVTVVQFSLVNLYFSFPFIHLCSLGCF